MPCMKTSDRLATILFLLAAPAARLLELKNNYDPAGLPTGGFPYLPAVLAAAAVVFLLSARGLPARDAVTADFGGIFRFDGQLTLTAAVLGGFLLLAAAALPAGEDAAGALRIWRRDRRKHASPNSAQCEAAMAGALGLRISGPARYFGVVHDKPWIGDEKREIEPGDIDRACRMETIGSLLGLALFGMLRLLAVIGTGG